MITSCQRHRSYWLSCEKFTVQVDVDKDNVIVHTAPIVRKFVGQQFDRLVEWMAGLGGLIVEAL